MRFTLSAAEALTLFTPLAPSVRAYALWEGWFGYDRKKYTALPAARGVVAGMGASGNRSLVFVEATLRRHSSLLRESFLCRHNGADAYAPLS